MLMDIRPPGCGRLEHAVASAPVAGPWEKRVVPSQAMGSLVRPVWPWVTVLSRLLRCPAWASATPERVAALQRKHPLAYRPRMRRGKLDDRAAHCGDFGMGLFIRGRYAGLWRVGVPEPAPHGATVVLQLN